MAFKLPSPSELWSHDEQRVRDFGKAFFVVLALFGALAARRALAPFDGVPPGGRLPVIWEAARAWWLAAWAVLTFSCAFPWFARPAYVVITVVGMSIGFVLGHLMLAMMFFTLFVTIGRFRRATSPVARGFDPKAPTYWTAHKKPESSARYYRQY